jgi:hypothetical protein
MTIQSSRHDPAGKDRFIPRVGPFPSPVGPISPPQRVSMKRQRNIAAPVAESTITKVRLVLRLSPLPQTSSQYRAFPSIGHVCPISRHGYRLCKPLWQEIREFEAPHTALSKQPRFWGFQLAQIHSNLGWWR